MSSAPLRWAGPIAAGILGLVVLGAVQLTRPPMPRAADSPTAFSTDSAWRHVEAVARAPHPVGTPEHDRVRRYVLDQLDRPGLEVDTQTTTVQLRRGRRIRSGLVRNVMARLPGTDPTGTVLMVAHYDATPLSLGAGDDGVGVATVLETARALRAGPRSRNDVIFLITDAEEYGLLGARAFAEGHPWMADVSVVVNFEARGTSGPVVMFETGQGSGRAVELYGDAARRPVASSLFPELYRRLPNDTDFTVFRGRGLPGLNFAIGGSAHWYHTPGDRPENLSRASLYHMGATAVPVARGLAALDLAAPPDPESVYFTVPGMGLVGYPAGLAAPLALLLALTFIGTLVYALRRGRRWWGVPVGLLVGVAAVAAGAAMAAVAWGWLRGGHAEYGAVVGRALYREWPYALAFVALAFAVVFAAFGALRRWLDLAPLALGALLVPVGIAVGTAFAVPGASYLFLWPSFLALAMVVLEARANGGTAPGVGGVVGIIALAGAILLLMAPVVYLVVLFLGVGAAPGVAATAGLVTLLLVPALDVLGTPGRVWLPTAAGVVGLVLLGLGVAERGPSPERPAPSNVAHIQDLDLDRAVWAVPVPHVDPFTTRFVAADEADTIRLGLYTAHAGGRYRVATAPPWAAPAARMTVLEEARNDTARAVRVRFAWEDERPAVVEVWPDHGSDAALRSPLPRDEEVAATPLPADEWLLLRVGLARPLEMVLVAPPDQPIRLVLNAHYPGLPAAEGLDRSRPPDRMATPATGRRGSVTDQRIVRQTAEF